MMLKKKILVAVLFSCLLFVIACQQQPSSFPDEPSPPEVQEQNLVGEAFAYGAIIPEGYGLPYDTYGLYTEGRQVLVSRDPGATPGTEAFFFMLNEPYQTFPVGATPSLKATATMPGGLIYNKGYIYQRGTDGGFQWVAFDYVPDDRNEGRIKQIVNAEGNLENTNWISVAARSELALTPTNLNVGENYVVAYTCLKPSPLEPWKCGCHEAREPECRRWTLQKFMVCEDGKMVDGNGQCVTVPDCPIPATQGMTTTSDQDTCVQNIFSAAGLTSVVDEQCEPHGSTPLYAQCNDAQELAAFFKCAIEEFPGQANAIKTCLGDALPVGLIEEDPVAAACLETFMNDGSTAPTTQSQCTPKGGDAASTVLGTCDGTTAVSYGCVDDNDACTRSVESPCAAGKVCRNGVCITESGGSLTLTSSAFSEGGELPISSGDNSADDAARCPGHLAAAENKNPPLTISNVPTDAKSLVLIMTDETMNYEGVPHWVVHNIPPTTIVIPEDIITNPIAGAVPLAAYYGPCPPLSERHTYRFTLLALSEQSDYRLSSGKLVSDAIEDGVEGRLARLMTGVGTDIETELGLLILDEATLTGTYLIS